jgi:hypothetical protein
VRIFASSHLTAAATPENLAATMVEEIAAGKRLYQYGVILQAYADPELRRTFMIVEAPSIEAARDAFEAYPQVRAGLIAFDFVPLIGLPAIATVHRENGMPLPDWWPPAGPR